MSQLSLTAKQRQCLVLAARGMKAREAAAVLGLSDETVRDHLEMVRFKARARNTAHAVALALAWGDICADDLREDETPGVRVVEVV